MEAGEPEGLIPCGLGCRDTLRLEASMPLYGHELSEEISPVASGLGHFVKTQKEEFIGKEALEKELAEGSRLRRAGLKVTGKGIIREHQEVMAGEQKIGMTTSGTHCPYLGYPVAMAMLEPEYAQEGTQVEAIVRGRRVAAEVVRLPFYHR